MLNPSKDNYLPQFHKPNLQSYKSVQQRLPHMNTQLKRPSPSWRTGGLNLCAVALSMEVDCQQNTKIFFADCFSEKFLSLKS